MLGLIGWLAVVACIVPSGSLRPGTSAPPTATITPTALILPTFAVGSPEPPTATASPSPAPSATLPYPTADTILNVLCFDFLRGLSGKTITLNSQADLTALYDQADKSEKCAVKVERGAFDFSRAQIIGAVYVGEGCDVALIHAGTQTDDSSKKRVITMQASPVGDCPYEVIYPVWFVLDRLPDGYSTVIQFVK